MVRYPRISLRFFLTSPVFLHFIPGVVNVPAGRAPAEGSISAPAERQAACSEKRAAEEQTYNSGGDFDPWTHHNDHHHHHHNPGNCSLLFHWFFTRFSLTLTIQISPNPSGFDLFCVLLCVFFIFTLSHLPWPVRRQWDSPREMGSVPLLLLHLQHIIVTLPRRWFICLTWTSRLFMLQCCPCWRSAVH